MSKEEEEEVCGGSRYKSSVVVVSERHGGAVGRRSTTWKTTLLLPLRDMCLFHPQSISGRRNTIGRGGGGIRKGRTLKDENSLIVAERAMQHEEKN